MIQTERNSEGAAVIRFTYSQHGRSQQPPGEELQEDHHNCMGDFGSAWAVLPTQEDLLDIHEWKGASVLVSSDGQMLRQHQHLTGQSPNKLNSIRDTFIQNERERKPPRRIASFNSSSRGVSQFQGVPKLVSDHSSS